MDRQTHLKRSTSFNALNHNSPPSQSSQQQFTSNPNLNHHPNQTGHPPRTFTPPPPAHHSYPPPPTPWEHVAKSDQVGWDGASGTGWGGDAGVGGPTGESPVSNADGSPKSTDVMSRFAPNAGSGAVGLQPGSENGKCAIFWDFENCPPPTNVPGYAVVDSIRRVVHHFGCITLFKAYLQISETTKKSLRSELQSSGVSLTDTPHNARKDAADKMILVDMLAFAIDNPPPATIVLISGDRDFVYALSTLRNRRYNIILIVPNKGASVILKSQANAILEWRYDVLNLDVSSSLLPTSNAHPPSFSELTGLASMQRSGSLPNLQMGDDRGNGERSDREPSPTRKPGGLKVSVSRSDLTEEEKEEVGRYLYSPMAPGFFDLLVEVLNHCKLQGDPRPKRSKVAAEMLKRNPLLADRANVKDPNGLESHSLRILLILVSNISLQPSCCDADYMDLAAKSGIVILGGGMDRPGLKVKTEPWIAMNEDFVTAGF
ncbi:hypothetical protein HK097_003873 [Rhizophlyctis rosea]|uniref:NYN domain-containing protein n=1 Tax=Rhizophlyctis rosea TaxID=64517 RepID=A0AAD5SFS9_9FUNG|nr:hypothetical protein HK097_003873 [Rhizophlyctis rosea]